MFLSVVNPLSPTATYISDCDSLLQTIVMWAEQTIPQSFSSILDGLLQDDVESPLLGFLRLVFFKLLTEQDNCFVKALCTCVDIHRVMVTQRSEVNHIHKNLLVSEIVSTCSHTLIV